MLQKDLTLTTIRHYNDSIIAGILGEHQPILMQQTKETVQFVL